MKTKITKPTLNDECHKYTYSLESRIEKLKSQMKVRT